MIHVPINCHLKPMKSGGEFRLWTYEPFISRDIGLIVADDTGWFDNLLLDGGLVQMTTQTNWANFFHIGESSVPPSFTDTQLIQWLAASSSSQGNVETNLGPNDYQGQTTRTRRFNAGAGTGTIREIGVNHTGSNVNMSIRTLVSPEITKAAAQILDASYRFTTWPSLVDGTGTVNIFGDDYDYTVRMGRVQELEATFDAYRPSLTASNHRAYNGDIGTITDIPAGADDGATSVDITSQGSGFCNYTVKFNVDSGNLTGGIRSIASRIVGGTTAGSGPRIQVEFRRVSDDATIDKINTREISFDLGLTWGRH